MRKVVSSSDYNSKQMQVIFKLNHAETRLGQNAHVVGGTEQMGAWKPTRATRMTSDGIYPKWKNEN